MIIMAFAVLFLLFALFAGKFAPYDPLETHYTDLLKAPCKQYLMGTDQMGRDIFSRILYGGKTSLLIAFVVTAIISVVGILIGTIAGFWGGAFDAVLMRLSDMQRSSGCDFRQRLPADPGICYVDGMYLCTGESFGRYILPVA